MAASPLNSRYIGAAEPLYSGSLFSPTIIAALGTFSTSQSLLLSTPPYVVTFITTLGTAWWSDRIKQRGIFLIFWGTICVIGYAILLAVDLSQPGVLYFAVFLTVSATGPMIGKLLVRVGTKLIPEQQPLHGQPTRKLYLSH